jgi:hypothetical protein
MEGGGRNTDTTNLLTALLNEQDDERMRRALKGMKDSKKAWRGGTLYCGWMRRRTNYLLYCIHQMIRKFKPALNDLKRR